MNYQSITLETSPESTSPLKGEIERSSLRYNDNGKTELTIDGWLIYSPSPIKSLQFALPGSEVTLARRLDSPDVGIRFPEHSENYQAGFRAVLSLSDRSAALTEVCFTAILANGLSIAGSLNLPETEIKSAIKKTIPSSLAEPNNSLSESKSDPIETQIRLNRANQISAQIRLTSFLASDEVLSFQQTHSPQTSIIMVLYNKAEYTLDCLRSLKMCEDENFEIILVDNASSDQTDNLISRVKGVTVIKNQENRNFVFGVNQGAEYCVGENILLLNNDTTIVPGSIAAACKMLNRTQVGAVGGRVIKLDGTLQEAGCGILADAGCYGYGVGEDPNDFQYLFERKVDFCSGTFLMTKRILFESLGGLDPLFAPAYYEEVDYCLRLAKAGYEVRYEPNCVTFHVEHGSSSREEAVKAQRINREKLFVVHKEAFPSYPDGRSSAKAFGRVPSDTRKRILLIDDTLPFNEKGSGAPRTHVLINSLVSLGADLTFYPMLPTKNLSWHQIKELIPPTVECLPHLGIQGLHTFLSQRARFYDKIIISRPHNMEHWKRALELMSDILLEAEIIYDAEAIFAEREVRKILSKQSMFLSDEEQKFIIDQELELAKVADKITVVSERDAESFRSAGFPNVDVVSYGTPIEVSEVSFEERRDILFVGPLLHDDSPNVDSTRWFINEVLGQLRTRFSFKGNFRIVGGYREDLINALRQPGVDFTGPKKSVAEVYANHRIAVAPTRFAAGISLKVIEAASYGLPVVASDLIAELLNWDKQKDLLTASSPSDFAYACHLLYNDKTLWTQTRQNALDRVKKSYTEEAFITSVQQSFLET